MGSNSEYLTAMREALRSVQEALGLPQLVCLLTIALEPGLSVNELAERTGYPQQSASRYAALLLGRYENPVGQNISSPLIEQTINPSDPRKRSLHLTRSGEAFIVTLLSPFNSSSR
jgi:DNA-binding MarR family transcriptional regulator